MIEVEYKDGREWVLARTGNIGVGIADYPSSSADAEELLESLSSAGKKPIRAVLNGQSIRLLVQPEHLPPLD